MKIIYSIVLLLGLSMMFGAAAHAQTEEGDIKLGVGLVFGSGVGFGGFDGSSLDNDLGIRVDGYYAITEVIRAGGDFTYYFPKSDGPVSTNVWELNLNGHYIFMEEDELILYGLAGINITGLSVDYDDNEFFGGSYSDSEFGLNLGGGVEYDLDFADLFAEAKIGNLGGNANQFVLGVGLRFSL